MILNMIGADGESETTIKLKLWPIIYLIIAGMVGLGIYVAGQESRLCVVEKSAVTVDKKMDALEIKLTQIADDQNLYYSIREPRWEEWKKWNEKKRKNGNGVK